MSDTRPPRWPADPGRRLWDSVVDRYELDEHERALLVEAVRTVDLLDHEVRRDVPTIDSPWGLRAHPAAVEARQQRIALARLISPLRLPDDNVGVRRPPADPSGAPASAASTASAEPDAPSWAAEEPPGPARSPTSCVASILETGGTARTPSPAPRSTVGGSPAVQRYEAACAAWTATAGLSVHRPADDET